MKHSFKTLDFDTLKDLAASDPDAFENFRRGLIEEEIQKAPADSQRRLRGLQWRIDVVRNRYKHPMISATKLFDMMWQKVYGKNGLYEVLTLRSVPATAAPDTYSDNIVRFRGNQRFGH